MIHFFSILLRIGRVSELKQSKKFYENYGKNRLIQLTVVCDYVLCRLYQLGQNT